MSSDDATGSKTVRVPVLMNVKEIQQWLVRFQAFAMIAEIFQAVGTTAETALPDKESDMLDLEPFNST